MINPDLPPDEPARLAALYATGMLESGQEERFDRITRTAARLFEVPVALVTLIDRDDQVFKSCVGTSDQIIPRSMSFCAHAVAGRAPMMVPDLVDDERFFDNPLVVDGPRVRFYAGHPIRSSDGQILGTLCVLDVVPRAETDIDMEAMADLAGMVDDQIRSAELALVDPLTGMCNRRAFGLVAERTVEHAKRSGEPVTAVMLDVDHLKDLNDEFGHARGDAALEAVAAAFERTFRRPEIGARFGGDEFALLMLSDTDGAVRAIRRFTDQLSEIDEDVTVSFGFSTMSDTVASVGDLLAAADADLYRRRDAARSAAPASG